MDEAVQAYTEAGSEVHARQVRRHVLAPVADARQAWLDGRRKIRPKSYEAHRRQSNDTAVTSV